MTFECDFPPEARSKRIVSTSALPPGLSPAADRRRREAADGRGRGSLPPRPRRVRRYRSDPRCHARSLRRLRGRRHQGRRRHRISRMQRRDIDAGSDDACRGDRFGAADRRPHRHHRSSIGDHGRMPRSPRCRRGQARWCRAPSDIAAGVDRPGIHRWPLGARHDRRGRWQIGDGPARSELAGRDLGSSQRVWRRGRDRCAMWLPSFRRDRVGRTGRGPRRSPRQTPKCGPSMPMRLSFGRAHAWSTVSRSSPRYCIPSATDTPMAPRRSGCAD